MDLSADSGLHTYLWTDMVALTPPLKSYFEERFGIPLSGTLLYRLDYYSWGNVEANLLPSMIPLTLTLSIVKFDISLGKLFLQLQSLSLSQLLVV